MTTRPRILFLALTNDLGCERVVAEMMACGLDCGVISPRDAYCAGLEGLARRYALPGHWGVRLGTLFVRQRLEKAVREWRPRLILPLDDLSAWLLRSLAQDASVSAGVRDLLAESLGAASGYKAAVGRRALMDVAEALHIRKPRHCEAYNAQTALAAAAAWNYPVVIKADHTCGGVGVTVAHDPEQLLAQLAALKSQRGLGGFRSWLKAQVYRHAGFRGEDDFAPLLQSFVPGTPAFRTVATWKGRVLAGVSFAAEQVHPAPNGASTVIRHIDNAEMERAAAQMAAALGCSGFVSFDFMLDPASGQATVIELNPRSIGSTHLGRLFGSDVCGALAERLTGKARPETVAAAPVERVALFPKEMERDPYSPRLSSPAVFHDVPGPEFGLRRIYRQRLLKAHPGLAAEIRAMLPLSPTADLKAAGGADAPASRQGMRSILRLRTGV